MQSKSIYIFSFYYTGWKLQASSKQCPVKQCPMMCSLGIVIGGKVFQFLVNSSPE